MGPIINQDKDKLVELYNWDNDGLDNSVYLDNNDLVEPSDQDQGELVGLYNWDNNSLDSNISLDNNKLEEPSD